MFDRLIVSGELVPVREAAMKGDMDAMFRLAEGALSGLGMKRCGDTAVRILDAMIDRDEIRDDIHRFVNVYVMMVQAFQDQYEKGKLDRAEFAYNGCFYLSLAVQAMTKYPHEYWQIGQMQHCLNWIAEYEELARDYEAEEAETIDA